MGPGLPRGAESDARFNRVPTLHSLKVRDWSLVQRVSHGIWGQAYKDIPRGTGHGTWGLTGCHPDALEKPQLPEY